MPVPRIPRSRYRRRQRTPSPSATARPDPGSARAAARRVAGSQGADAAREPQPRLTTPPWPAWSMDSARRGDHQAAHCGLGRWRARHGGRFAPWRGNQPRRPLPRSNAGGVEAPHGVHGRAGTAAPGDTGRAAGDGSCVRHPAGARIARVWPRPAGMPLAGKCPDDRQAILRALGRSTWPVMAGAGRPRQMPVSPQGGDGHATPPSQAGGWHHEINLADQGRGGQFRQRGGCKELIRLLDSEAPTTLGGAAALPAEGKRRPMHVTPHETG